MIPAAGHELKAVEDDKDEDNAVGTVSVDSLTIDTEYAHLMHCVIWTLRLLKYNPNTWSLCFNNRNQDGLILDP